MDIHKLTQKESIITAGGARKSDICRLLSIRQESIIYAHVQWYAFDVSNTRCAIGLPSRVYNIMYVCLLGNLFLIPKKSNSFLRWLQSLAATLEYHDVVPWLYLLEIRLIDRTHRILRILLCPYTLADCVCLNETCRSRFCDHFDPSLVLIRYLSRKLRGSA